MSRHTWACFSCRTAARREASSAARCPSCGKPCERLGTKIPVPPKGDAKAWKQVEAHFRAVVAGKKKLLAARLKHELDLIKKKREDLR